MSKSITEISQQDSDKLNLVDQQLIAETKDGPPEANTGKSLKRKPVKSKQQATRVTTLFASALNLGSVPMNPADYIHHVISRVKVKGNDKGNTVSIAQFVGRCRESVVDRFNR
jgi:hypothetical protein